MLGYRLLLASWLLGALLSSWRGWGTFRLAVGLLGLGAVLTVAWLFVLIVALHRRRRNVALLEGFLWPVIVGMGLLAAETDSLFLARFAISRAALDRYADEAAERLQDGDWDRDSRRVGLFFVLGTYRGSGCIFLETAGSVGFVGFDTGGIVRSPRGLGEAIPVECVSPLGGRWWKYTAHDGLP